MGPVQAPPAPSSCLKFYNNCRLRRLSLWALHTVRALHLGAHHALHTFRPVIERTNPQHRRLLSSAWEERPSTRGGKESGPAMIYPHMDCRCQPMAD